jgi:hypothetical protein
MTEQSARRERAIMGSAWWRSRPSWLDLADSTTHQSFMTEARWRAARATHSQRFRVSNR